MANIYKNFGVDDIVVGDIQTVSQPLWSENINALSGGYSAGVGFFTSSTQISQSGNYYTNVYHRNPNTDTNAAIQFSVAYGNRVGSGSVGDTNTVGQNVNDTPTRAIYGQYRNLLLPPSDTAFTFSGSTPNDIFVINVARSRFKQKLDPGNWTLRIGSGSGGTGSAGLTTFLSLTDNSGANTNPEINQAGRIFYVMSGSDGTTVGTSVYGLFYPDAGVYVLNATLLSSSLGMTPGTQFNTGSNSNTVKNAVSLYTRISASNYYAARSEEKITSTHFFVRITNKEFNFSNNPTFVTGSNGDFVHSSMLRNPSVYVTTIGMYDDANRLLAVAKLSQPLLKTFNREALVKVKLDY